MAPPHRLIPAKAGTQDRSEPESRPHGWDVGRGFLRATRRHLSWALAFAGVSGVAGALALFATPAFAQGDPKAGQQVFQDNCAGCHVLTGQGFSAPPIAGVYGRKAGTADFQYSDAMKKSGIVWDDASLHAFLADPSKSVPDTAMNFSLTDPQQRDDVVAYLKTLSPGAK